MKRACFFLVLCLLTGFSLKAEEKLGVCVDGDSDSLFCRAQSIPVTIEQAEGWPFPKFEYDSNGQKGEVLKWVKAPEGITRAFTRIGRYNSHDIVEITFSRKLPDPDNPSAPFAFRVLSPQPRDGEGSAWRMHSRQRQPGKMQAECCRCHRKSHCGRHHTPRAGRWGCIARAADSTPGP